MTAVSPRRDRALLAVAFDQSSDLRPAQSSHLGQVAPYQPAPPSAQLMVAVLTQHLLDPAVDLGSSLAFEPDALAGIKKGLHLLEVQLLCFVHAGGQSSACHRLQAHLAMEWRSRPRNAIVRVPKVRRLSAQSRFGSPTAAAIHSARTSLPCAASPTP